MNGCYKEAAKILAKYIVENNVGCPIPPSVGVPDCCCWGNDGCVSCVINHAKVIEEFMEKERNYGV